MNKEEKYHGCLLMGGEEPKTRDGDGYWIAVYPENITSQNDKLFSESTFISGTAEAD